jgi:hypothetical protein
MDIKIKINFFINNFYFKIKQNFRFSTICTFIRRNSTISTSNIALLAIFPFFKISIWAKIYTNILKKIVYLIFYLLFFKKILNYLKFILLDSYLKILLFNLFLNQFYIYLIIFFKKYNLIKK